MPLPALDPRTNRMTVARAAMKATTMTRTIRPSRGQSLQAIPASRANEDCNLAYTKFGILRRSMTQILDGKKLAQTMQAEIAAQVADFTQKHSLKPGLAAVLVGDNPASQVYVRNKRKACDAVGMQSWQHSLPAATTQD